MGYSDLFVLSKKDMWDVLKDYPAARVRLEAVAVKRLEKYKRAPLDKGKFDISCCLFRRCINRKTFIIQQQNLLLQFLLTIGLLFSGI